MIIINSVNDTRFSLNGIEYLKNYISQVHGQSVEIYNCYERNDILLEQTKYNNIILNGQVYNSAAGLHAALQSALFTRSTLTSGSSDFNQDNKGRSIYIGTITEPYSIYTILNKINSRRTVIEATDTPVIFWGDRLINGIPTERVNYLWMGGKGVIGTEGSPANLSQLYLLPPSSINNSDIEEIDNSIIIDLGEVANGIYIDFINAETRELSQADKKYYFSYTNNGNLYFVIFKGIPGIYNGNLTISDFTATPTNTEIIAPGLNDVLKSSFQANDKRIGLFENEGEEGETYLELSANGYSYRKNDYEVSVLFSAPVTETNVAASITVPAVKENDSFALRSDTKKQQLKVIDNFIINNLYTITADDFGKTLIYSGVDNIDMLLGTDILYENGYTLHFLQAGAGTIKFVTNGFILHHAADELPETYGFYSMAALTILDEFSVMVFGKLKLAD
ncbi:hypothetical protein [Flavobacterium sp.]|uniref:hypothetical protein n=1 Tax=Flavobacterium sp. TaxID=239 RepID=UPI002620F5D3|nr:hypothetical protein [Flavobacterium sp.]